MSLLAQVRDDMLARHPAYATVAIEPLFHRWENFQKISGFIAKRAQPSLSSHTFDSIDLSLRVIVGESLIPISKGLFNSKRRNNFNGQ